MSSQQKWDTDLSKMEENLIFGCIRIFQNDCENFGQNVPAMINHLIMKYHFEKDEKFIIICKDHLTRIRMENKHKRVILKRRAWVNMHGQYIIDTSSAAAGDVNVFKWTMKFVNESSQARDRDIIIVF